MGTKTKKETEEVIDEVDKNETVEGEEETQEDGCTTKERKKDCKRIDWLPMEEDGPNGSYMVERMKMTPEGFLAGRAIVTNVGVFPYLTEDGVRYELRLPEEVFAKDSVKSLENCPMTNLHPTGS